MTAGIIRIPETNSSAAESASAPSCSVAAVYIMSPVPSPAGSIGASTASNAGKRASATPAV